MRREFDRIRAQHGIELPDLNIGTAGSESCAPALGRRILDIAQSVPGHTAILNGRYTGGYITRHYGDPASGVHAVQMEMAQSAYMEEECPWRFVPERAAAARAILREQLETALAWVNRAGTPRV